MKFSARRQGKKVIDLENAQIATPDGRTLVEDLTWRLGPGERIGLVGVNGSGKTTLLRALAGEHELTHGKRLEGKTVRLGWLRQELDDLDPSRRLLDAVEDVASYVTLGDKELSASQLAERLGFSAKRQRTPVGDLSGGERRRLQLTRVLMAEPNVLLLDEPTNDLDIDTLQELESLLDSWPGTLVVISHDRYLIERICDSTWALFGDGRLTNLPGGIEQYLERRQQLGAGAPDHRSLGDQAAASEKKKAGNDPALGAEGASTQASSKPALSAQEDRELQKEMNALERKMDKLSQKLEKITAQMADVAETMVSDPGAAEKLTALDGEAQALRSEHEELEMAWLEAAEKREG